MGEIGRRAAAEIRRTAHELNSTYIFALNIIDVSAPMLWDWEHDKTEPSRNTLQRMAFAGYDIHYILTGERK
jgi:transcriptional regulator with XRE-family HTH domain